MSEEFTAEHRRNTKLRGVRSSENLVRSIAVDLPDIGEQSGLIAGLRSVRRSRVMERIILSHCIASDQLPDPPRQRQFSYWELAETRCALLTGRSELGNDADQIAVRIDDRAS
jgi:hypothetical protein